MYWALTVPCQEFVQGLRRFEPQLVVDDLRAVAGAFLRIGARRQLADSRENPRRGLALPAECTPVVARVLPPLAPRLLERLVFGFGPYEYDILPHRQGLLLPLLELDVHHDMCGEPVAHGLALLFRMLI